jgi:c-di-GMP-binding flagellar brake protein YcgR
MNVQLQQSSATALPNSTIGRSEGGGSERRTIPRYPVDAQADATLLKMGTVLHCELLDLSLGGCCLRTQNQFTAGIKVLMELVLRVRGTVLRLNGVSQWTDRKHLVGVRFIDMNVRRTELLSVLIEDVEFENKNKAQIQLPVVIEAADADFESAGQNFAEAAPVTLQIDEEVQAPQSSTLILASPTPSLALIISDTASSSTPTPRSTRQEAHDRLDQLLSLRQQKRYEVDSMAVVHLVNIGVRLAGRIQDLSPGGCRIRTDERFSVGIYVRAEVDFHLEGLPFRLPGVTQAIYDKHTVGVRFLDMSERKREQLHMLIEELKEIADYEREIKELQEKETEEIRRAS